MNKRSLHRAAIRRLRRGVVASSHLGFLSVGGEYLVARLRDELGLLRAGKARACFVDGEWGTGKTHLLGLIRYLSVKEGCAVAYLNLNGQGAALNHPQRFYHLIATRLQVRGGRRGLAFLLARWARDVGIRSRLTDWAIANLHRSELARALEQLVPALPENSLPGLSPALSVILGTDLAWADYAYKREKAVVRIADLGECLASAGSGGLVLELDELETIEQLWNIRSRIGAYSILGRLTEMSNVWPCFAITDRFRRLVELDLTERGLLDAEAVPPTAYRFLAAWKRGTFPTLRPVMITPELALILMQRIIALYGAAYGPVNGYPDRAELVGDWARSPVRSARTLIRRIVHHLDIARDGGFGTRRAASS